MSIYALMVLCGMFALLGYFNHDEGWQLWLAGFMGILAAVSIMQNKKAPKERQDPQISSVLPEEAKKQLEEGTMPKLHPDVLIYPDEQCIWMDRTRTDFYDSKPVMLYLTTRRLFCTDPNFRFSHPLDKVEITPDKRGVKIRLGSRTMPFLMDDALSFEKAWKLAKAAENSRS